MANIADITPPERRRLFSLRASSPHGTLARLRRYPAVAALALALLCWLLAAQASQSTWSYYTMLRFGWDDRGLGLSLAAAGVAMIIVQGWLTRRAMPALGKRRAALLGIGTGGLGLPGYALATHGWMMYAWTAVASLGGFAYPPITALMSGRVDPSEPGALQGSFLVAQRVLPAPRRGPREDNFSTASPSLCPRGGRVKAGSVEGPHGGVPAGPGPGVPGSLDGLR